jgi:hypothetical protein
MTEHFAGAPRTDQISSAEVNSACGKVLLRKTLGVEQKRQRKGDDRGLFLLRGRDLDMQLIQLLLPVPAK